MVPLDYDFHAYLRKDGVRIAGKIGVADTERSHIHEGWWARQNSNL
jgi:hypothetical protein